MQVLSEGQCIKHEQYGFGIVAESDNERTTICLLYTSDAADE